MFPVTIELNSIVHDLKEKIVAQNKFSFRAMCLELYLTRKDGSWVKRQDVDELLKGRADEICRSSDSIRILGIQDILFAFDAT
uniref:Crinkler effector protein N-terminal domain-containing protein n=1 Tax=Globisporangium ultimum (strain ATCC 200006 / CBS 805.95 / DAOM BR144) TaxID=431595 RepID=K3WYD1_GLOUD